MWIRIFTWYRANTYGVAESISSKYWGKNVCRVYIESWVWRPPPPRVNRPEISPVFICVYTQGIAQLFPPLLLLYSMGETGTSPHIRLIQHLVMLWRRPMFKIQQNFFIFFLDILIQIETTPPPPFSLEDTFKQLRVCVMFVYGPLKMSISATGNKIWQEAKLIVNRASFNLLPSKMQCAYYEQVAICFQARCNARTGGDTEVG
jgi:hypothetical protein